MEWKFPTCSMSETHLPGGRDTALKYNRAICSNVNRNDYERLRNIFYTEDNPEDGKTKISNLKHKNRKCHSSAELHDVKHWPVFHQLVYRVSPPMPAG